MATTYPSLSVSAWRTLRARSVSAPSTKFTPGNIAALLGLSSTQSATNNVVLPMRRLGLMDDDGSLTPRGQKWRVDSSFADACQEILDHVYPDELTMLTDDDGTPNAQKVKLWFDRQGFGASNARGMASTYVMIASKQLPDAVGEAKKTVPKAAPRKASSAGAVKRSQQSSVNSRADDSPPKQHAERSDGPNVHLDIQIHIPADASADQIDQIFASMARHLYGRAEQG
jgi:hypothetical protein